MQAQDSQVSVVVATYNGEEYLRQQLETILAQTLRPAEVLVADDGSTDGTLELAREVLAGSGVEHTVVANPINLGYGENFLRAAGRATSSYIAFSDQDDVWHPRKLELSIEAMQRDGSCMAVHPLRHIDGRGTVIGEQSQGIHGRGVLEPLVSDPFGVYFGLSMVFDARLLRLLPHDRRGADTYQFTNALAHDRWVYFLATCFGRTSLLPDLLIDYRQHVTQSFGAQRVSLKQRFLNKVSEGAPRLADLGAAARARAELVAAHRPSRVEASLSELALWGAVADRYHRVADLYEHRAALYRSEDPRERAAGVVSLARAGAYREVGRAGLGRKRVLEDLSVGLLRLGAST